MSKELPLSLKQALASLQSGAPDRCIELCNETLAETPGLIQAHYLRGCAAWETGDFDRSADDLDVVFCNHPGHLEAAYYLGRSLRAAGRFREALAPLQAAAGEPGLELRARYELATCLSRLRQRPEAIDHYRAILELEPGNAQVAANLAALLERENRLGEAELWTDRALRTDPANETARVTRATVDRRNNRYAMAVERLRKLIPDLANPVNRSIAWNQLGQALEGLEAWDEAFDAFSESNRILKRHHPGTRADPRGPHGMQTLARIHDWLEGDPVSSWSKPGSPDPGGIAFLVGFPRSGTTLLDRMLSAHPDIEVLEEKSLFAPLHQDWAAPGVLEALAEVNDAQIGDARETYRHELSAHRKHPGRGLAIDKLPLNLAYLFLIHRLFPAAPVIVLQRHPLDVCTSCFFQAFELEASMAYFLDLADTASYYDAVMRVAVRSLEQVANPLHVLRYEDLVTTPREQLEALLRFLDAGWDDSVLEFHRLKDARAADTPSYQQVSQPLYSRSVGRWRHYAGQLDPVRPLLQPWVERFGYRAP